MTTTSANDGGNGTTKEIAPPEPAAGAPAAEQKALAPRRPPLEPDDGGVLNSFASEGNFMIAQRMAGALAASSLVPEAYIDNIPNCLIAIELANRLRTSVFVVMQNMDVIHGRPGWRSQFMIGTVNASRRFTPLRFRWAGEQKDGDKWGCRAVAKDRETGEECVGALIDVSLAKAEGWFERKGSKWKTMPEQMLMYRAAAFWARIYAPELFLGIQSSEEVEDVHGAIDVSVAPAAAGRTEAPAKDLPGSAAPADQGRRMSLTKVKTQSAASAVPAAATKKEAEAAAADPLARTTTTTATAREPGSDDEDEANRKAAAPTEDEEPSWAKR